MNRHPPWRSPSSMQASTGSSSPASATAGHFVQAAERRASLRQAMVKLRQSKEQNLARRSSLPLHPRDLLAQGGQGGIERVDMHEEGWALIASILRRSLNVSAARHRRPRQLRLCQKNKVFCRCVGEA